MTWAMWLPIIQKVGVPVAGELWRLIQSKLEPTEADWRRLNDLASQTGKDQLEAAILRAGLDLGSPQAQALMALVK